MTRRFHPPILAHSSALWKKFGRKRADGIGRIESSFCGVERAFFKNQFRPSLNELRHDADGDFLDAPRFDVDADGTGDARKLLGRGELFLAEMIEDDAGLARAADHADEQKWFLYPILQHERVMTMAACDNQ